jgi:hypothetical protein
MSQPPFDPTEPIDLLQSHGSDERLAVETETESATEIDANADPDSVADADVGIDGCFDSDCDLSDSLEELAEQLEQDPSQRELARDGLASLEPDIRERILAGLARLPQGPGLSLFLRSLDADWNVGNDEGGLDAIKSGKAGDAVASGIAVPADATSPFCSVPAVDARASEPRVVRTLITPVDGKGRAAVALSCIQGVTRRTAVFGCNVVHGVEDAAGLVEPDSAEAGSGGLLDALTLQVGGDCLDGPTELALRLLAGALSRNRRAVPAAVRHWLDETLGEGFRARPLPPLEIRASRADHAGDEAGGASPEPASEPDATLAAQLAQDVLEACPSWLDLSPLTFELAEEIDLREGAASADPIRDAGAYRYLFEHRLIHRLELYRANLVWMAWYWWFSGDHELARSALLFADQLSDEQYAVPSHPFTVALTTRSLNAAQARLHEPEPPTT